MLDNVEQAVAPASGTLSMPVFRKRFNAAVRVLKDFLGYYEVDQADWQVDTLLTMIRDALASLAQYAQDPATEEVAWESPYVELQYDVTIDWKAFEKKGHLNITHETFTSHDLEDSGRACRKIASAFVGLRVGFLLKLLTKDVLTVIEKDRTGSLFPPDVMEAVEGLPPDERLDVLREFAQPFCLGCGFIDADEVERPSVSPEAMEQLQSVADAPSVRFTANLDGKRITGSVALVVSPLTLDTTIKRAYYPVTIALAFGSGEPPEVSREQQAVFWNELVEGMDELIAEQTTWDPSFIGKAEPWDRSDPRAIRASKRIAALAAGTLDFATVPHREFEELVAELYAGLGCRVRLTRKSRDGGRDVIVDQLTTIATRVIIECKRPNPGNNVEVPQVRAFFGVANDEANSKAVLVTSSGFTPEGRKLEERHRWRFELVDGRRLARLASRYSRSADGLAGSSQFTTAIE